MFGVDVNRPFPHKRPSSANSTSWEKTLRYQNPSRAATSALPGKAGLITEWTSKQKGPTGTGITGLETFAFSCDKAGRFTNNIRYMESDTTGTYALTERDITYDASGNLLTLNRYGNSSTPTDALSYSYDGPKRTGWSYDPNGNVTSDASNSVSIAWNVIDMPRTLTSGTTSTQRFYLADGTLSRIQDGSQVRIYLGDIVFKIVSGGFGIESAGWEGGRLLSGTGNDKVLYFVNDHLGSVRAIKDGAGTIRQRFDYYPYGSVSHSWSSATTDTPDKRYRFGGKEIAGTVSNATSTGADKYLDFGARLYNPRTAIWLSQDPMAEKYYPFSPYLYCAGNPVNVVDPTGKDIAVLVIDGQHIALLIENEEGKWEYYSINGNNMYLSGNHTGGRQFDDLGENLFDSPQAFLDSYYNQDKGKERKNDKSIANYNYSSAFIIETDDDHLQDNTIRTEFKRISKEEPYSLFKPNHCATVVQRSLQKGGIETRAPYSITSPIGVVSQGFMFPYLPSSAYKQIKWNNSGHEIHSSK